MTESVDAAASGWGASTTHLEPTDDAYVISDDVARLDLVAVHAYLVRSYWAAGIPIETVRQAAANSICFGVYRDLEQVGFARAITDRATFAYLADVYILEGHRGRRLGKRLVERVLAHPDLQRLRRFMLVTRDAAALYEAYGFRSPDEPSGIMQIRRPNAYQLDSSVTSFSALSPTP
ncbi:MAG: GNAT family N-acetyltransferase [Gemmatimonadaceae bacterium]|nr:GNAT family N-acetyltransferase [Gemmatimonadaceae bacterium]